jgi:electron transport complex protein RnfC
LLHGVHVPHRKNTADSVPTRMPPPASVTIPMSMNIGKPAVPVVNVNDTVKVGQLIAEAGGFVSAPIYSGVSGKVKKIDETVLFHGATCKTVVIETDGEQTEYEGMQAPAVTDFDSFIDAVAKSGVVGLGGAGFPTAVKLKVAPAKVDFICINGAECEPYITADTRTMLDDGELLVEGIDLLKTYYPAAKIIVGIENNKPQCVKHLKELTAGRENVEVRALRALYPQGGEKVLIHNTTGRIVPEGKLPIDVGCIVINTSSLVTIARYIKTGRPLVEKYVTVDGSAVRNPQNVIVPIGTAIRDVVEFTGGFREEPKKIVLGGPMMGISVPSTDEVVVKNTGAILCFAEKDAVLPEPTACIRCGSCIDACPLNLMPTEIERAYDRDDAEALQKLKVNLCMECGCCAFVCPAKRRLVETNKLGKIKLNNYLKAQKAEAERKAAAAAEKEKEKEVAAG